MTRLGRAWGALGAEQRLAALAALGLLVTMFLPWYELQSVGRRSQAIYSHSISAFGDVSFVEAAVFLVAAGVIALLFARAERRDFHMPGSDGAVVMLAGGWATLLIFYRVFSRPDGHGYPVGIQWGFFLAFVAAGLLTYAGWRMRAGATPEPPLTRPRTRRPPAAPAEDLSAIDPAGDLTAIDPAEDLTTVEPAPERAQRSIPVAAHAAPELERPRSTATPSPGAPTRTPSPPPSKTRKRPRYPPTPAQQLSFEDQPPDPERN
ncbi:MAG: hypothetical protein ACRDK4_11820 [Solirubrobacteraceae bacterium]